MSAAATASSASTRDSFVIATRISPLLVMATSRRRRRFGIERRVLPKDRPLQLLERGTWLDPELVDERTSRGLVGVQRLSLPARPVQRRHQICLRKALAKRVLGDEYVELPDQLVVAPECEVGVDPELERCEADLPRAGRWPPGAKLS